MAISIIEQFRLFYRHPPQVSNLVLPRACLASTQRAGWRDWLTGCRDVRALIRQVDFGSLVLKRNSHFEASLNQSLHLLSMSFRFDNFGCLYYYHKDRRPPPLHGTEGEGALKENEATHEAKMNHV